jgi:hypothetical protein
MSNFDKSESYKTIAWYPSIQQLEHIVRFVGSDGGACVILLDIFFGYWRKEIKSISLPINLCMFNGCGMIQEKR